jgi:hypothetical protein
MPRSRSTVLRSSRKSHLRQSLLILGIVLTIGLTCMGLVSFFPESYPGTFIRDQWLVHSIQQEQRGDGFFVWSVKDKYPPVIPETYFAISSLRALHSTIPHQDDLDASLLKIEKEANTTLQQGHPIWGPREVYEDLMIHQFLGVPVESDLIAKYVSITRQHLSKETQLSNSTVHDWYYAVQTLIMTHHMTQQTRKAVASSTVNFLHDNSSNSPLIIAAAYVVDIDTSLHITLDALSQQKAVNLLVNSETPEGGYIIAKQYPSDILTSYFAVILAYDLNKQNNVQSSSLLHWLAMQRSWDGYRMTANTQANPLATADALALRGILNGTNIGCAPR